MQAQSIYGGRADLRPPTKAPTMGLRASKQNHRAMAWSDQFLLQLVDGWVYVSVNRGSDSTRMQHGKKTSCRRQCDPLGNVLLRTLGSCHTCDGCVVKISLIHGGPTLQLAGMLQTAWCQTMQSLVKFMSRRVRAVLMAEMGPTLYQVEGHNVMIDSY